MIDVFIRGIGMEIAFRIWNEIPYTDHSRIENNLGDEEVRCTLRYY